MSRAALLVRKEVLIIRSRHRTTDTTMLSNRMTEVALIIEVDATASALADRAMAE
jgi:hypothetical protein